MKLTGKAEKDFNKYLMRDVYGFKDFEPIGYSDQFNNCIESMRLGVYLDFFDSIGIFIDVYHVRTNPGTEFHIKINGNYSGLNISRIKAFEVGVNMANEIYNAIETPRGIKITKVKR